MSIIYSLLRQLFGILATAFSRTSTFESGFSPLGREDTKKRSNITMLTPERSMH